MPSEITSYTTRTTIPVNIPDINNITFNAVGRPSDPSVSCRFEFVGQILHTAVNTFKVADGGVFTRRFLRPPARQYDRLGAIV